MSDSTERRLHKIRRVLDFLDNPLRATEPRPAASPGEVDDWPSGTCTVCGGPTMYGDRHVQCAPGYMPSASLLGSGDDDQRGEVTERLIEHASEVAARHVIERLGPQLAAEKARADAAVEALAGLRAASKHLLAMIESRVWRMTVWGSDVETRCSSAVGPDEPCGECIACWTYNVEKSAASLRALLPADTAEDGPAQ